MQYHEAQAQHAAAHPFQVERLSIAGRWLFIGERKSRESAERLIEHYRAYPAYANNEYRIVERGAA